MVGTSKTAGPARHRKRRFEIRAAHEFGDFSFRWQRALAVFRAIPNPTHKESPMSRLSSFFSRCALVSLGAFLTVSLAAQQVVCLSLHGVGTGLNSNGQPAQVAARVQGVPVSVPTAAGQAAAAASAAHEAAFAAAGFATMRTGPNWFCLLSAPGGAPITSGSCYGTDDMGFDLDSDVSVPAGAPPAGAAVAKANGALVPLPPVQQPPQPFGGVIVIWIWVRVGSQHVLVIVQIHLQPNMNGFVLRQIIIQQLLAHGFLGNVITVADPMQPNQRMEVLQLERTVAGDPVVGIEYMYDAASRRIVRNVTGAGTESIFGAYEYGQGSLGLAPRMPWSHLQGAPRINSFFDVFHEVGLPNAIGGNALGLGKSVLPVWNGNLLVDPLSLVIELGLTDANGTWARHWVVPGNLALVGFPLHSQGFGFQNGQISMTPGVALTIGM